MTLSRHMEILLQKQERIEALENAPLLWDDIPDVQGWWDAEERCFDEFEAAGQLVRECLGDQGNGLYEFREEQDLAYDDWQHCIHVLETLSTMIRGW